MQHDSIHRGSQEPLRLLRGRQTAGLLQPAPRERAQDQAERVEAPHARRPLHLVFAAGRRRTDAAVPSQQRPLLLLPPFRPSTQTASIASIASHSVVIRCSIPSALSASTSPNSFRRALIKPMGYISKTCVEGTTSLTGPYRVGFFRKSYTLGAWRRTRSAPNTCSPQPGPPRERTAGKGGALPLFLRQRSSLHAKVPGFSVQTSGPRA